MEEPGRRLRRIRERLRLKYRDVEEASQDIARHRGNQEFSIGLSRLADIENKGTLPSFYRLYSLCAIYGLDFEKVLRWYGINLDELTADAARLELRITRLIDFNPSDEATAELPADMDPDLDLTKTFYLTPHVRRWGQLPFSLLRALDIKRHRYAFIGTDDWFMYPVLPPGSFVQIDEGKRRLSSESWSQEYERPIHLVEHRGGYCCGWCTERSGLLIVQAHSASQLEPEVFRYPGEADIVGQVVAVAMRLDLGKRRRTHF